MYSTTAFGKASKEEDFKKMTIKRNECGDDDVEFDVKFCGICHTDVHFAMDEAQPFRQTSYPCVPGHELAGIVTKVGKNVSNFKPGDRVGVGCLVDSCMGCRMCNQGEEQYCEKGFTMTYDFPMTHGHIATDHTVTYGGYSERYTVNKRYAVKIPDNYPLEAAGPIFCAGITMYSPLKHWGAASGGKNIGIVGIGGLGQMGVLLAKAMGNKVTAISTSRNKEAKAREIGADDFVVSTDEASMAGAAKSLDLIINTVSANHQLSSYLPLLRQDGTIVMVGVTMQPHQVMVMSLMMTRNSIAGSSVGGMPDTQEVIDFCAKKNIKPAIEIVTADQLKEVYDKLGSKNDAVVRYVLDITKSLKM